MQERQTPPPRRKPTLKLPPKREVPVKASTQTTKIVDVKTRLSPEDEWQQVKCLHETVLSETIINPAHITVGGSVTKNLGDMEFAKVFVQITRPCLANSDEMERVYGENSDWVDQKVRKELSDL